MSHAAFCRHIAVVELLLERIGNADQKDEDGRTRPSYAVECGIMKVAEAFLERNDVDIIISKDNDGRSPLSWAFRYLHSLHVPAVKLLLKQNVTEEDRYLMKKESKHLGVDSSVMEEEEDEEQSQRESEEQSQEAGSELEQNSKATKRKRSPSEQPGKRIRTRLGALSD